MSAAAACLTGLVLLVGSAEAGNYIVHVQGRSMSDWNNERPSVAGFTNVTLAFDGSAKLNGPETNDLVAGSINAFCSGGNSCILHAYSTGGLRMLKAVSDLRARGYSLPGLLWAECSGCAAGGTALAEIATQGLTGLIAKLIGLQEAADHDLTRSAARNRWGYVQDDMGAPVYHVGGKKDICVSLLFFKLCGGSFIPGVDDGVVGLDSAAGASSSGSVSNGCTVAKYPYRVWDSQAACGGVDRDHLGIVGTGTVYLASRAGGSGIDNNDAFGPGSSQSGCSRWASYPGSSSSCDAPFQDASLDWAADIGAPGTHARSSDTSVATSYGSCYGKCGGYAGGCWCDSYGVWEGTACGDYTAANCDDFNNIRDPVYRSIGGGKHRFTTDINAAVAHGSLEDLDAFYLQPTNQGGMGARYACKKSSGAHFIWSSSSCNGHQSLGLMGYGPVSQSGAYPDAKPLYELRRSSNEDYVYTLSSTEKSALQSQGYSHIATWYAFSN